MGDMDILRGSLEGEYLAGTRRDSEGTGAIACGIRTCELGFDVARGAAGSGIHSRGENTRTMSLSLSIKIFCITNLLTRHLTIGT